MTNPRPGGVRAPPPFGAAPKAKGLIEPSLRVRHRPGAWMQYKYVVLTNTTIGAFMALLYSNMVLISLPTIIDKLPGMTIV